jgi:hypothetical protein
MNQHESQGFVQLTSAIVGLLPLSEVVTRNKTVGLTRAALSIWWALRTSPYRGPNPSVDRRVRWIPAICLNVL